MMGARPRGASVIVRCPECRTTYEVSAPRAAQAGLKVRCPRCKTVFSVEENAADEPTPREAAVPEPPDHYEEPIAAARPKRRITDPALARRMARAMISEMLLNRRQERDLALTDDQVLSRFGTSIASAYGVYREKVSPDLGMAPGIFKDAVNDILGDGVSLL